MKLGMQQGTVLGTFEIVALLGIGGMGEVYRARDTKLGRDVALKILPEEFSRDKERLDRFEREARLLAQLNHANIATLYGLEEHEGQRFLVMELVEGETLAERIAKGRIPVDEAIPLFIQIAEGLEAAHEKGVIHRDLKPANIKIEPDGTPKILDFSLAKGGFAPDVQSESSPATRRETDTGVILGTAAYMSPEQARGKTLDKRTDIWSFGCVLGEALTGKVVFLGETVSDTIAAILKNEPDWQSLPANTPAMLRSLVRRCLEKNPKRRLHDASDARILLEEALAEPPASLETVGRRERRARAFIVTAGIGLFALMIGALSGWRLPRTDGPASRTTKQFTFTLPGLATGVPDVLLALSRDGRTLVYRGFRQGTSQLYLRSMDNLGVSRIMATTGASNPFLSPDASWVGFFSQGKLKKVSLAGGSAITICDAPPWSTGSWGAGNAIVFQNRNRGLSLVSANGGVPEELATGSSDEEFHLSPQFLPGGSAILFAAWSWSGARRIVVYSLDSGEQRVLVERTGFADANRPRFASGHIVFGQGRSLWAIPFDVDRLETTGDPFFVLEGVQPISNMTPQFDVAKDGTLVYLAGPAGAARRLVWVDRQGREEPTALPSAPSVWPRLSPGGTHVVETVGGDVWIGELRSGSRTRVTIDPSLDVAPIWTPDGERVVFDSHREEPDLGLFWKAADGTGSAERLMSSHDAIPCCWAPDGKTLVFEYWVRAQQYDIGVLSMEGERAWEPLVQTDSNETAPTLSPDGRWIAYASDETGQNEIYIQRFPELGERRLISNGGGFQPLWSPGTQELFYRRWPDDAMMVVPIATEPTLTVGSPDVLFAGRYARWVNFSHFRSYDIAPDGQRFLMVKADRAHQGTPTPAQIIVILNWYQGPKRLTPTDN